LLADRFQRLLVRTPRERLASDVGLVTRQGIYRRLYGMSNVEIVLLSDIHADSALDEGCVSCRNVLNDSLQEIDDLALLTWSGSRAPNDELAAPLRAEGLEVLCVGDCDMPRTLLAATTDGHALGRSL
ncbi:MAG: oxidoreductase, partial [Gammaproteobacteria bacterium]|nr:oxidoreductase [Gammaproteobacteria bacterium]